MGCFSVSSQISHAAKAMAVTIGRSHDEARVEPVEILALVEHDLQRTHPHEQQQQADAIDRQSYASASPGI